MRMPPALLPLLVLSGCAATVQDDSGLVTLSGTIQVLAVGTRSETVILEEPVTGTVYALVGDEASVLRDDWGMSVTVVARPTEEGFSVRPDLPKLWVVDCTVGGDSAGEDPVAD